jgi:DNA mismatch repair protein MutS
MAEKLTPMMQQYFEVKRGLPANTLLLFRLGDFYEMFFADAEVGARLLGITLTKRGDTPMAGIPHHSADNYVTKLLAAGKKVAICDQAEAAQAGKLVKRQLTRILSPGTTLSANQLDASQEPLPLRAEPRQASACTPPGLTFPLVNSASRPTLTPKICCRS